MDRVTFERIVEEELAALPEEFARHLGNVQVLVEDQPSLETLRATGLDPRRDTLFGLYEGVPLGERGFDEAWMPDRITLYYRPLVRTHRTPLRIRREIRLTLMHEIAHFFGMEEDEIEELGY